MISMFSARIHPGLLLLLPVLSVFSGCEKEAARPSGRGSSATPVEAVVMQPQLIENKIFTTGTLLANEEVELRPEISGRVTGVFFEEGKHVKKGDLLLKINDRELQAELKRKKLQENLASDEERRKRTLVDMKGISQEEYDKSLNALNMIIAEREVIESQLAETEIIAPFDGVVGLRYVSEGSFVSSSTRVATIQDIDSMKVEFSIPEKYAGQLTQGTPIAAQVGESQDNYKGTIYAVEAKVDPATRTLKARAVIPNLNDRLIPGSFSKVTITLERIQNAMVIPTEALIPEMSGERVFVCVNGQAQSIPVITGIRTERAIQITDGLKPGDTLIVTGLLQLIDGKAVQINLRTLQ